MRDGNLIRRDVLKRWSAQGEGWLWQLASHPQFPPPRKRQSEASVFAAVVAATGSGTHCRRSPPGSKCLAKVCFEQSVWSVGKAWLRKAHFLQTSKIALCSQLPFATEPGKWISRLAAASQDLKKKSTCLCTLPCSKYREGRLQSGKSLLRCVGAYHTWSFKEFTVL